MKKTIVLCLAVILMLTAAGCINNTKDNENGSPVAGKKVAYIMQMAPSDIFTTWSDAAEKTALSLGMEYDAFFCGGSDEEWKNTVEKCAAEGYDGLLLSHGGESYAYSFLSEITKKYPELKIVTFDTLFTAEDGGSRKIEGITQFFQQDAGLTALSLDYIINELYPEKKEAGEPVNILKVWVGPGFLSAFDRREEGYREYEENGLIKTVETIAPSDFENASSSAAEAAEAALSKYAEGEIDAVWCCYDLYAAGVFDALTEGGYDIPMVSIDISDSDIEKMSASGSPWKACVTTNWSNNGEFGIRALALALAGEYDKITDPVTKTRSSYIEIPGIIVTQDMVAGKDANVQNLSEFAGEGYIDRSFMPTSEWMDALLEN